MSHTTLASSVARPWPILQRLSQHLASALDPVTIRTLSIPERLFVSRWGPGGFLSAS